MFASLLLQAFYSIPQVRDRLREAKIDPNLDTDRLGLESNHHVQSQLSFPSLFNRSIGLTLILLDSW